MPSKLRPLYDKLYTGVDTRLLAYHVNRDAKKTAAKMKKDPAFDRDFRKIVLPYWKEFGLRPKKYWFRIYCEHSGVVDPRYIPDDIWFNRIIPYYNNILFSQALQDKCLHNLFLPFLKRPETIVKNINGSFYDDDINLLSESAAISRVLSAGRFLVKPSVGSGKGMDIRFFTGTELSEVDVRNIFRQYNHNFIIQKKLVQHKDMAAIHPNSLNTLRMITFVHNGKAQILTKTMRIGSGPSELDNYSQGGFICKICDDGRLDKLALSVNYGWTDTHPSGMKFADVWIPNFSLLEETVKKAALKNPHFRVLGWDFAIDEVGDPVLIEYNVLPYQNQKTFGPTFGDETKEILSEIFKTKETR